MIHAFATTSCLLAVIGASAPAADSWLVSQDELRDRIQGAWMGMLIGGLEGLVHEFKYEEQPRDTLPEFNPNVTGGLRTDDDNDFELTHLYFMDQSPALKLPYDRIVEIWKANINEGIWCANAEARALMDQGVIPPATADPERNSFASFNLSGQFAVEMYGAVAPAMPRAAADLGSHYAGIAVSGEPLQATRYWTSLVSIAARHRGSLEEAISAALDAVDPDSAHAEMVRDALAAFHEHPDDWKAARQILYTKWLKERGWNRNSTPSNGAMVILALLYGRDDFYKTIQYAMAMGLDADCNAATAGAVLGMRLGYAKLAAIPGFNPGDTFTNLTRPGLPRQMKLSEQVDLFMRVCERVILENGGARAELDGAPAYRIVPLAPSPAH